MWIENGGIDLHKLNNMNKETKIKNFLGDSIGFYKDILNYEIILNDETRYATLYEVVISNTTNQNKVSIVLKVFNYDKGGGIYILCGDEFIHATQQVVLMDLFLSQFLTFKDVPI